jgi:6-phosphogluconolactonase
MRFSDDILHIAPSPIKLAEELAGWFYAQVTAHLEQNPNIYIAFSGGNSPIMFFRNIAEKYGKKIEWHRVHIFWADEKCVAPDHYDSNYFCASKHLLSRIEIPEANIHRIHGENTDNEPKRYAQEILSIVPKYQEIPCFDLFFLGMGDDGHIASIFTGQNNIIFSGNIVEPSVDPRKDQKRITITPYCINNSKKIIFNVSGLAKSAIVEAVINKNDDQLELPGLQIKPALGEMYWFFDIGAAQKLFV